MQCTQGNQRLFLDLAKHLVKRFLVVVFPVYRVSGRPMMGRRLRKVVAYWSVSKDEGIGPGSEGGPSAIVRSAIGYFSWLFKEKEFEKWADYSIWSKIGSHP